MMLLWVILLPFAGGVAVRMAPGKYAWMTTLFIFLSCMLFIVDGYVTAVNFDELPAYNMLRFMEIDDTVIYWSFSRDIMSMFMAGALLLVSLLAHIYTVAYMPKDDHEGSKRFFSLLSLFTSSMLVLIFANNSITMYLGWEGISIISFFIIGFHNDKTSNNFASIKAFLANRVGDVFFLASIFMIGFEPFKDVFETIAINDQTDMKLAALFLFIAVMSKSAQVGFHFWLPEAMVAPMPATALLHSSTMVAAGIFIMVKMFVLFEAAPDVMEFIKIIGLAGAVLGGFIAIMQNNIKKILAYSTISQVGLMIAFFGAGYPMVAMFYLLAHAIFKSSLFLGSGVIIHALSEERDINKMGGLYKVLPLSYILIFANLLAINSMPFFAGFYAKEVILSHLQSHENFYSLGALLFSIGLTACYSTRMFLKVFHGKNKTAEAIIARANESSPVMLLPVLVLVVISCFFAYMLRGFFIFEEVPENVELGIAAAAAVAAGILYAVILVCADKVEKAMQGLYKYLDFDAFYQLIFRKYITLLGRGLWFAIDLKTFGRLEKIALGFLSGSKQLNPKRQTIPVFIFWALAGVMLMVMFVAFKKMSGG